MLIEAGQIVKSTSGRDQGRFYVTLRLSDGCAFVADGKLHKLAAPKKKNPKHLAPTARMVAVDQMTTDAALRRILAPLQQAGSTYSSEGGAKPHVERRCD